MRQNLHLKKKLSFSKNKLFTSEKLFITKPPELIELLVFFTEQFFSPQI